jgi:hypothetical protein
MRAVLLTIIENLARDEQIVDMSMPSTRYLGRLVAGGRNRRARNRMRLIKIE